MLVKDLLYGRIVPTYSIQENGVIVIQSDVQK